MPGGGPYPGWWGGPPDEPKKKSNAPATIGDIGFYKRPKQTDI